MTEDIDQREEPISDQTNTTSSEMGWGLVDWQVGAISGIVGAAVMGVLISVMMPPVLQKVIPAMYKLSGGVAGWTIHLSHGAVLGVAFVALTQYTRFTDSAAMTIAAGIGWGVVTWVGLAALVMPVWLSAVGAPVQPMVPNFAVGSLIWHLVYGMGLGSTYHLMSN